MLSPQILISNMIGLKDKTYGMSNLIMVIIWRWVTKNLIQSWLISLWAESLPYLSQA